jgi:V/A-type H+-transporting ATPase subunit B
MKDGIGEGYTRKDHSELANQVFSAYSHVQDVKSLAQVIGEEELSEVDKHYLEFGRRFEESFVRQRIDENRDIIATLDLGWELLSILPKEELDRVSPETLDKYYRG